MSVLPAVESGPVSCAWCRAEEPGLWLLRQNHWTGSHWQTIHAGLCIALDLRRNHLWYALRYHGDDLALLRKQYAESWDIWRHHPDPDPIFEQARDRIALLERLSVAPEHAEVAESEEVSLW